MKLVGNYLVLLFLFLPLICVAKDEKGEILHVKKDVYQIDYANQLITVYFNYLPDDSFEQLVSGIQLSPERQLDIVRRLRDEIDQLPADFIGKFLGLELYPMHIVSERIMGYYSAGKIVLEISESKLNQSTTGALQVNFLHEVAHHLYDQMQYREETKAMVQYLQQHQRYHPEKYTHKPTYMENGYVSFYSHGGFSPYDPEEEFAELFAHLLAHDSRTEILDFIKQCRTTSLDRKIHRFISYLGEVIPSLNHQFFFGSTQQLATIEQSSGTDLDAQQLLASHEQKSYELSPQGIFDEALLTEMEAMADEVEEEFHESFDIEEITAEDDVNILFATESNPEPEVSSATAKKQNKKKERTPKKKKRKKKGEGWLLSAFGIAMAIAAEFLL